MPASLLVMLYALLHLTVLHLLCKAAEVWVQLVAVWVQLVTVWLQLVTVWLQLVTVWVQLVTVWLQLVMGPVVGHPGPVAVNTLSSGAAVWLRVEGALAEAGRPCVLTA